MFYCQRNWGSLYITVFILKTMLQLADSGSLGNSGTGGSPWGWLQVTHLMHCYGNSSWQYSSTCKHTNTSNQHCTIEPPSVQSSYINTSCDPYQSDHMVTPQITWSPDTYTGSKSSCAITKLKSCAHVMKLLLAWISIVITFRKAPSQYQHALT